MSPQFAIDGERLFNVLLVIVIASFFIERALPLVFESIRQEASRDHSSTRPG